jgi:hypothetical protein
MLAQYRKPQNGIKVIVCDPLFDERLKGDFNTGDIDIFMDMVKKSQSCACFVDESGEVIGRYNSEYFWLATRARHYGHRLHFITQRVSQLNKTVRDQCTDIFIFRVSPSDAKLLAEEFSDKNLLDAANLQQWEYFHASRFKPARKYSLFNKKELTNDTTNSTDNNNGTSSSAA